MQKRDNALPDSFALKPVFRATLPPIWVKWKQNKKHFVVFYRFNSIIESAAKLERLEKDLINT